MDESSGTLHLDDDNPWPGLDSYNEASKKYFHGRDADSAELLRLVRLSPFVMLYGKSGLGKSSMLQAGVFPALREARCLPVHLRLDYTERAELPPLQQALARLMQEVAAAGADAPPPEPGEGLWAYLQRRERPIWTRDNFPLTPVLVFDQFEEVFSRGGAPAHVKQVLDALADLVGDRLTGELVRNPEAAKRLNLQSQQYRVVLSFRSDFLAEVESWQRQASLPKHEALHLKAMTRETAIEAVAEAGAAVLAPTVPPLRDVASLIVDFVLDRDEAGGGRATEVEPVLLSLCCYQLNSRRQRPAKIDQQLLRSAGQDILLDFYREALAGTEPRVAVFIEDNLIQGGKFRSSYPREEALSSGALLADELELLTHRRLLRIDPQGDVPRIELIHDRLVGVVRDSKEARRARERQQAEHEEAERLAKEQRARERMQETTRSRNRLRWVLAALALVTLGLLFFAFDSNRETERANAENERALALALKAGEQAGLAQKAADEARQAEQDATEARDEANLQTLLAKQERAAADEQRQIAQAAEERALASLTKAKAAFLVIDAQATLSGTRSGTDTRAYQQLLAARLLQPVPEIEGSLLDALVTRQHLRRFAPVVVTDPSAMVAVAFSPDGRLLATGHLDGSVALRSVAAPQQVLERQRGHTELVQMVSFSADGRLLLSASNDGTVRQWQVAGDRLAARGEPLAGHRGGALSADYNEDASLIVTSDADGWVRLWQAASGQPAANPAQVSPGAPVWGVAFRPGRRDTIVAVGRSASAPLTAPATSTQFILLDSATLKERAPTYQANAEAAMALAFTRDGSRVASGGKDNIVRVREMADMSQSARISGHRGDVQAVAFSADGQLLASGSEDTSVRLWLAANGDPLGLPLTGHTGTVTSVAFSPDGRWLASGDEDGSMRLWQLDPSWVTPGSRSALQPDRISAAAAAASAGAADRVVGLALSPDGERSVLALGDGRLRLRAPGRADAPLDDPRAPANAAAAACASAAPAPAPERNRSARGINSREAAPVSIPGATSVAFSADGRRIASGHGDGRLRLWNAQTGQPEGPLLSIGPCVAVTALAWSADGRHLAAASAGMALLFDTAGSAPPRKLALGHPGPVSALALSSDARWLAAGGTDATGAASTPWLLAIDTQGGGAALRFEGLLDLTTSLAFSPDAEHLVSGNAGGKVRVWERRSRQPLGSPIDAHRGPVMALAFTPDGSRFQSSGPSGGTRPWPAPQTWVPQMCAKLESNLSRKAWRELVSPDIAYRCACPGLQIDPDDPDAPKPPGPRETCPVPRRPGL